MAGFAVALADFFSEVGDGDWPAIAAHKHSSHPSAVNRFGTIFSLSLDVMQAGGLHTTFGLETQAGGLRKNYEL